jgi:hypothetical protein
MVGVLGMLAMPFLIAGTLGFLIWRASKKGPPRGPGGESEGAPSGPR